MLRDLAQDVRTDEYNPKWIEDEPHTAVVDSTTGGAEYGGGPNAYFQLEESPFRTGIEGVVFTLKYAIGGAELTEVVGKAEPEPGEFYVDYKEAGRKGTVRVEVNVADAGKGFLVSYYGVGAVGSVANIVKQIEETSAGVVEAEVTAQVPGAVQTALADGFFFPGRSTQFFRGPKQAPSSSFPWHPYSSSQLFTSTTAAAMVTALRGIVHEYKGNSSFAITRAYHGSGFGDGVQRLEWSNADDSFIGMAAALIETARFRSYSFAGNNQLGYGGVNNLVSCTANASTNVITTSQAHNLTTGLKGVIIENEDTWTETNAPMGDVLFVRVLSSTTFTMHPTKADAEANTNIIDFTAATVFAMDVFTPNAGAYPLTLTVPVTIGHLTAGTYNITGIYNSTYRMMTIKAANNTEGGAVSGNVSFYEHRVAGNDTAAVWHAIEDAALMSMRSDGSLANGLERLDAMQGHWHDIRNSNGGGGMPASQITMDSAADLVQLNAGLSVRNARSDGTNGTPRTGAITRPRSVIVEPYVYVGPNTLS